MMNYDDKHLLNIQTASGKITKKLLEGVSNDVISPISIYRLLMILSEVTAGETKEQVDRLIGEKRIDPLAMKNLFEVDKDETVCKLADSIWVNPVFDIEQEKLDELHNLYDADVYSVPMGTEETDRIIQSWVNRKTRNLLKDHTGTIRTNQYDVAQLISTIYLKSAWRTAFELRDNLVNYFTDEDGNEVVSEYMCSEGIDTVFLGDQFSAMIRGLDDGFEMVFILPEKGTTLPEILEKDEMYKFLIDPSNSPVKECYVIFRTPKFDTSSKKSLKERLIELGIENIFDEHGADFSPFANKKDFSNRFCISGIDQAARVKIDEKGMEGAAWTRETMFFGCFNPYEGIEMEVVKFYLERPFVFAVIRNGIPLFCGTVTAPLKTNKEISENLEVDTEAILRRLKKAKASFERDYD